MALGEQEEGVGGEGRVVGDFGVAHHFLEFFARHPFVADAHFLRLGIGRPGDQVRGQEIVAVLRRHAVGGGQRAQVGQLAGAQAGLLGEFHPGEFFRCPGFPVREAPLRERPAAPPDGVAVLLDQVETVILGGDDQGEVAPLYDRVGAAGSVAALDVVLAEPDPVVGVDDAAGDRADLRVSVHRIIVAPRAPAAGSVTSAGSW